MATQAPEETDILCENCGYMLNGLPPSGNCPECGTTIDLSVSDRFRQPALWESIGDPRPKWLRFLLTTSQIIFHPKHFFRHITSRGQIDAPYRFAQIHWAISSILLGVAAWVHWLSEEALQSYILRGNTYSRWLDVLLLVALPLLTYLALAGTIHLAARLTAWEAAYRGYRLPHGVVTRALYYHSAHLLPVAVTALVTCVTYNFILRHWLILNSTTSETKYVYTLCGEVVVSAAYLFHTYWIGMKNLMYANR